MSILETQTVACPSCKEELTFETAHSVLADRRPDMRAAILAGTFQAEVCEHCGTHFRREPDLNYLDIARGQWILTCPATDVVDWPALEARAQGIFELGYGVMAPAPAQEIGRDLAVRVAFGWPALREKILAAEAGLDDALLECLKLNILRTLDGPAMTDTVELRLHDADEARLTLAWLDSDSGELIEIIEVPRAAYDRLAEAGADYAELRASLGEGPFVDMNRLLIDPTDREPLPEDALA